MYHFLKVFFKNNDFKALKDIIKNFKRYWNNHKSDYHQYSFTSKWELL